MSQKLRLTHALQGRTMVLAGFQFVNGFATFDHLPASEFVGVARYLGKCYQAKVCEDGECTPETSVAEGSVSDVHSGVQESGGPAEGATVEGDGSAEAEARDARFRAEGDRQKRAQIVDVVNSLDEMDPEYWTEEKECRVDVVSDLTGITDLTREDINFALEHADGESD